MWSQLGDKQHTLSCCTESPLCLWVFTALSAPQYGLFGMILIRNAPKNHAKSDLVLYVANAVLFPSNYRVSVHSDPN